MKILFDTNILVFIAEGTLSKGNEEKIFENDAEYFYSTASLWELVTKALLGKIDLKCTIQEFEEEFLKRGYQRIDIKASHVHIIPEVAEVNKDPFDRILVAQAVVEKLTICTSDKKIAEFTERKDNRNDIKCLYLDEKYYIQQK